MTLAALAQDLSAVIPEFILAMGMCSIVVVDMFQPIRRSRPATTVIAVLTLGAALISLSSVPSSSDPSAPELFFAGTIVRDRLSVILKLIMICGGLFVVFFSDRSSELRHYRYGEYLVLMLGAVFGGCFVASANNFIVFVLGFETLSLSCYVLSAYNKHASLPAEASLKYLLYGAMSSAIMLFGLSYVFGLTGTLTIDQAMPIIAQQGLLGPNRLIVSLSLLLVLAGIGFKIAAVPFHFWCPDVYQGSPTPVAAFLSVVSKTAGFAALMRLAAPLLMMPELAMIISPLHRLNGVHIFFGILALITMTYGNLAALRQTDAKRLLAYSSIAHAGYLLLGPAVFTAEAFRAVLAYLAVYLFMNLGAFWTLIVIISRTGSSEISSFRGFAYRSPFLFVLLFLCLVSLTGLPPTAGFAAKFLLFQAVVGAGVQSTTGTIIAEGGLFYFGLALAGVLNSAVSLYYYMNLVKGMVFESPEEEQWPMSRLDLIYGAAVGAPVLILLNFGPLARLTEGALQPVFPVLLAAIK